MCIYKSIRKLFIGRVSYRIPVRVFEIMNCKYCGSENVIKKGILSSIASQGSPDSYSTRFQFIATTGTYLLLVHMRAHGRSRPICSCCIRKRRIGHWPKCALLDDFDGHDFLRRSAWDRAVLPRPRCTGRRRRGRSF